jgi:protein kinase-like protein
MRCSSCSADIPEASRFCPACGEALSSASQLPTNLASPSVADAARRRNPSSSPVGRLASSDSIDAGGFTPGTVLSERYRIIGLIGRGGMGEVYRADDLKLGQAVALKFLPDRLSSDRKLLDRFFSEVRTARQVAHPNVCRVYDIGEVNGRHFLSMEHVDGEDLASLLRRIGRLPPDKALEIARQLCAGLAAAHDRGVLHRDLKPANIMVDGRGRARLMDFGLAVAAAEIGTEAETGGTPAYMAPEQFAGKGASVRSDLYALGLVLYEIYTGRRPFDAGSVAAYQKKHAEESLTSPAALVAGMDPAVERAIMRCVEKDPQMRPASAAKVAAALPGGDPLEAALAAGETPSPEMVAAAGSDQGLRRNVARGLLAAVMALIVAQLLLVGRTDLLPAAGSEKPPEVLRARAREILAELGRTSRPADQADDLLAQAPFLEWVKAHDSSGDRWRHGISRDAFDYFYRESPRPLVPLNLTAGPFPGPKVTDLDPPPLLAGMTEVRLDIEGRLKGLEVVPVQVEKSKEPAPEPDWAPLFRAAGLDRSLFKSVEPRWNPRTYADARAAWEGPHPERPGLTMRVEAAAYRGQAVSFHWIGPWEPAPREVPDLRNAGTRVADLMWTLILLTLLFGGAWLARQNLRAGRGDRRGAARFSAAMVVLQLAMWLLGAHHVSSEGEFDVLANGLEDAVLLGAFFWLVYIALEPFVRRHWPDMLISWTRLLSGGLWDPLVGRDLLLGAAAGSVMAVVMGPVRRLIPVWLGFAPPIPRSTPVETTSLRGMLATFLIAPGISIAWVFALVFFLVLFRLLVRRGWIAAILVTLLLLPNFLGTEAPAITLPMAALMTGLLVFVTIHFGLLAALAFEVCRRLLEVFVTTADTSAWYFYPGPIAIAAILAVALWGFRTSTASQPAIPAD